jgi:DHA2 family methylenomycin A resistance protein-like MFS transporter
MKAPSFGWTVLVTSLAFVVAQLDVSIVNLALPQIASAYHADVSTLQWIVDAYTLAFAVLMLSAGSISDRLGAKRIFQIGILIFGVASAGCALADTPVVMIASRVLQGVGAAMMIPSSLSMLNQRFAHEPEVRSRAVGLWTAAGSAAMAAGPMLGGLLIELANWRFIFLINIPICLAGFLMSFRLQEVKGRPGAQGHDFFGQATWALSITALIAAIIEGPKLGFNSLPVIAGLVLCVLLFIAFLFIEKKVAHPMLPFHLFASRPFNSLLILGAVLNGAYYGSVFIISIYLQKVLHYSSLSAGLAFIPLTAGFVISNVASAKIIHKYGIYKPILVGLSAFAAGFAGLLVAGPTTSYWQLFLPFLVISMGMGLAVPAMINGVLSSVDKQLSGTASAILTTTRQTAGAIGVAIFGAMVSGGSDAILSGIFNAVIISITFTLAAIYVIYRLLKNKADVSEN